MICSDCGRDHSNQFSEYPEGATVIVTGDFWGCIDITRYDPFKPPDQAPHVLIPAASKGRVIGHCDDGRVLVVFEAEEGKGMASHSFHAPETYFMVAVDGAPVEA